MPAIAPAERADDGLEAAGVADVGWGVEVVAAVIG